MKFDVASALKSGYSEQEVAEHLASQSNFDLGQATKSGYNYGEVIGFLGASGGAKSGPQAVESDPIDYAQADPNGSGLGSAIMSVAKPAAIAEDKSRPETSALRRVGDLGVSLGRGVIAVPEAAVGLASLVSGGRAGKLAEQAGFRPKEAKEMLADLYSDAQKQANAEVQSADGFGNTLQAAIQNPSTIAQGIVESVPAMLGGGVVGRGVMAVAPRVGAVGAGAVGEGALMAGQATEGIRQKTDDGLVTGKQALAGAGTGVLGAVTSLAGGRLSQKLGVTDVDTALTSGKLAGAAPKSIASRVAGGAVAEGALEELPQSAQEQVLQNFALDKPLDEGVGNAAAMGLLTGSVMGGAINAIPSKPVNVDAVRDAAVTAERQQKKAIADAALSQIGQSGSVDEAIAAAQTAMSVPAVGPVESAVNEARTIENDLEQQLAEARAVAEKQVSKLQRTTKLDDASLLQTALASAGLADQTAVAAPDAGPEAGVPATADDSAGSPAAPALGGQPEPSNPVASGQEPARVWYGRRGDGYLTPGDASLALPSRRRESPDLDWRMEQQKDGRYRLAGYEAPVVEAAPARPVEAGEIPSRDYNQARGKLESTLIDERAAGRIDDAFSGASAQRAYGQDDSSGIGRTRPQALGLPPVDDPRTTAQPPSVLNTPAESPQTPAPAGVSVSAPLSYTRQRDGTVLVKGTKAEIKAALPDLSGVPSRGGVVFGKSRAEAVAQRLDALAAPPAQAPSPQPTSGQQRLGRDSTPLEEGGRPFKTKKAAGEARKLQPMLRVVKVDGGFALAPKTPAQLAAQQKAAKRLAQPNTSAAGEPIPAHSFIASEGGLVSAEMPEFSFGSNPRFGNRSLFAGKNKGLTIERATEKLVEAGYLKQGASLNQARALIERSVTDPQYTPEGFERIAEVAEQTRFEDYLKAQLESASEEEFDPFGPGGVAFEYAPEYSEVTAQNQARFDAEIAAARAEGIDVDDILERMAQNLDESAPQQEFIDGATQGIAAARRVREGGGATAAGEGAEQGRRDAGRGGPRDGGSGIGEAGDAGSEGDGLRRPSRADVEEQQNRTARAAELDQRAQIDREASGFDLQSQTEESRTDNTGDMFGGPSAQDVLDERGRRSPKPDDGGEDLFSDAPKFSRAPVPIFYSELSRKIEGGPNQALPDQWRAYIKGLTTKGVKPDEIAWSGVNDWLQLQTGKVTKASVREYLDANGVRVEEVVLGSAGKRVSQADIDQAERRSDWTEFDRLTAIYEDQQLGNNANGSGNETKYAQYTVPGGENYRELLLTLPERGAERYNTGNVESLPASDPLASQPDLFWYFKVPGNVLQIAKSKYPSITDARDYIIREKQPEAPADQNYRSSHWDAPNVLAHLRIDDRTDTDGKRVLFINEIQSDWGQQGKREGFKNQESLKDKSAKLRNDANKIVNGYDNWADAPADVRSRVKALMEEAVAIDAALADERPTAVLAAPFVTKTDAWVSLALKRAIVYAAQNGYDRVAMVTGEQAAGFFDLSKQIDTISYAKDTDGKTATINAVKDGGNIFSRANVPMAEVEQLVGKEVATKIERGEGEVNFTTGYTDLSGLDLKVGGEGMRTFYDKIVPTVAKDILRKVGGGPIVGVKLNDSSFRTEQGAQDDALLAELGVTVEGARPLAQPGFDITPAMREKIAGGLPLFSREQAGPSPGLNRTQFSEAMASAFGKSVASRLEQKGVVVAVQRQSELPDRITPFLRDGDTVFGAYDPASDKTYVVLENISEGMVRELALHEIGVHYGFERMLGKDKYDQVMRRLDVMRRGGNPAAQDAYLNAQKNAARESDIPEETLAYLVQNAPENSLVQDIIARIKAFLFKEFGIGGSRLTEADLVVLANAAVRYASRSENAPSLETNGAPAYSRSAADSNSGGLDAVRDSDVVAVVARINDRITGNAKVTSVARFEDLPQNIQDAATDAGVTDARFRGITMPGGQIFIVHGNHSSLADVQATIVHELYGHVGLRNLFGPDMYRRLNKLYLSMGETRFRELADKYGLTANGYDALADSVTADASAGLRQRAGGRAELRQGWLMEELLSHIAGKETGRIQQLALEVVGEVRNWLRSNGFAELSNLGMADIAFILKQGRLAAEGGRASFDQVPAFSAQRDPASPGYKLDPEGFWLKQRRLYQDYFIRMKQVQDAVRKQGGTISEATDTYMAEELGYGRVQEQIKDFGENAVRPMVDAAQKANISLDELALYAYAKHAPERNAAIAERNSRLQDGGSGMTNAEAQAIVDKVKADGKETEYEDLRQRLMGMTQATRLIQLDEGLITPEEFQSLQGAYQDYVPLRGFEQVDEDDKPTGRGTGKGWQIRGKENMRALGRSSKAGQVIENIIADYERAIVRAERNQIGKVFLNFVQTNPDPNLWEVDAEKTRQAYDRQTGRVSRDTMIDKGEDTIGVKLNGQEVYVKIKDPLLARALREEWKDDDVGKAGRLAANIAGPFTTFLRNVYTRFNPEFAVINTVRDLGFGTVAVLDALGEKGVLKFLLHYKGAMSTGFRSETGRIDSASPEWRKYFTEYRAAGGTTGGFYTKGTEDIQSDIRAMLIEAGAQPNTKMERLRYNRATRLANKALRVLELAGATSEHAARVAAFRTAREMGKTPSQAASIAKNLTVNFNRKGEAGLLLNSLFIFFNAAIQGSTRLAQVLKNRRVLAYVTGLTAGITILAMQNAANGGEDEDDGQAYWDKVPDYVKERNIVIMLPPGMDMDGTKKVGSRGRYVTIPMAYGLNVFPVIGNQIADMHRNSADKTLGTGPLMAFVRVLSALTGAINPFGGSLDNGHTAMMTILPTILDIPHQMVFDVNGFGRDVAPYKRDDDPMPNAYNSSIRQAGGTAEKIAQWLNTVSGGDETESGLVDVSPGAIENLVKSTTAGFGAFIYDSINLSGLGIDAATGGSPDFFVKQVPVYRRLYGEVDGDTNQGLFYERSKEASEAKKKAKLKDDYGKSLTDPIEIAANERADSAAETTRDLAENRRDIIRIRQDKTLSDDTRRKIESVYKAQRDELIDNFNREWMSEMKSALNAPAP